MNSFSIAFNNFKRNIKTYSLYLMSMIFSVLVYYNFVALKYNPDFQVANNSQWIKGASQAVSYLLLIFIIFFIWFSSKFFLKQRKKEIGIYAFMGVSNFQIAFIYAIEVLLIGITAIVVGGFLGVVFCKLFLMMLAKVAILNMKIRFFFSFKAIGETALIFFVIFIINSILGYIDIARSKLIDLFNASKTEEKPAKLNYIKGILAIILIGIGYYFAKNAKGVKFLKDIPLAVGFVTAGTYWLFGSTYSIIMRFVLNRKKILYRGINIVSISNISFRIKSNYRTLATVAILIAVTLTCYGTVSSIKYFSEESNDIQTPYAVSYISNDNNVKKEVKNKIKENNNIVFEESSKFIFVKPNIKTEFSLRNEDTAVIKYSDFVRISTNHEAKKLNKIKKYSLKEKEAFYLDPPTVVASLIDYSEANIEINNENYIIKNSFKTPLFGLGVPTATLVLNDNDYNKLKTTVKEYEFNGIKIDNTENIKDLLSNLQKIQSSDDTFKKSLFASTNKDKSSRSLMGIVYFLGAFLALVFIIATGSIIYFKVISEAYMDKEKFRILRNTGMTEWEANKAVSRQIGLSYILPLIVGIIHSCVAMSVLSNLMSYNIIIPTIKSIIVFAVVYGMYFIGTTKKYMKIVMED